MAVERLRPNSAVLPDPNEALFGPPQPDATAVRRRDPRFDMRITAEQMKTALQLPRLAMPSPDKTITDSRIDKLVSLQGVKNFMSANPRKDSLADKFMQIAINGGDDLNLILDAVFPDIRTGGGTRPVGEAVPISAAAADMAKMSYLWFKSFTGIPFTEKENEYLTERFENSAELFKTVGQDPGGYAIEHPVLTGLALMDAADLSGGGMTAVARASRAMSIMRHLDEIQGNTKKARQVLMDAGVDRRTSKALAPRLAVAETAEDIQSIMADAVVLSPARRQNRVARFRKELAQGQIEDVTKSGKALIDSHWDMVASTKQKIARGLDELDEAIKLGIREEPNWTNEVRVAYRNKLAAMGDDIKRLRADLTRQTFSAARAQDNVLGRISKRTKNLEAVPSTAVPTIRQFEAAMQHQFHISPATDLENALIKGVDLHKLNEVLDLPIFDPFAPDGRLVRGKLARGMAYVQKNFISFERARTAVTRLFGRESMIMQRTPFREQVLSEVIEGETYGRYWEAQIKQAADPVLTKLSDGDLAWLDAPVKTGQGVSSTQGREWMRAGRPEVFRGRDVPLGVQEAGDMMQRGYNTLWRQIVEAGRKWDPDFELGWQKNYVPNTITPEVQNAFIGQSGELWHALKAWAEREGKDLDGIVAAMKPSKDGLSIRRASPIDFERLVDLPAAIELPNGEIVQVLEPDVIRSFYRYTDQVTRRLGTINQFGLDNEKIVRLIQDLGDDSYGRMVATEIWGSYQGFPQAPGAYTSTWGRVFSGMDTMARGFQLSASVIPNTTGIAWVARKWGVERTLGAQRTVWKALRGEEINPAEWKMVQRARSLGAFGEDVLNYLGETELVARTGGPLERIGAASRKSLRVTGLGIVEQNTNKVAAIAALRATEDYLDILRKGNSSAWSRMFRDATPDAIRRELKRDFLFTDADIDRIIKDGFSVQDKARIAQRAPALVNAWRQSPTGRYKLATHPAVQPFLAYTSWVRVRGHMVFDALREAGRGNVGPLLKELGYSQISGEIVIALKDFFRNHERNDPTWKDHALHNMMESAAFGYWGAFLESLKYSASGLGPFKTLHNVVVPPAGDWLDDTYKVIDAAVELAKERTPAEGANFIYELSRMTPAVRATVGGVKHGAEWVFPGDPFDAKGERKKKKFKEDMRRFNDELREIQEDISDQQQKIRRDIER